VERTGDNPWKPPARKPTLFRNLVIGVGKKKGWHWQRCSGVRSAGIVFSSFEEGLVFGRMSTETSPDKGCFPWGPSGIELGAGMEKGG